MRSVADKLSYANVIATLALFIALGGGAYAVSKNSVGTKQLKNNAVTSKKIDNGSVKSKDVKAGGLKGKTLKDATITGAKVADGAITGAKVADGALGFDKLAGIKPVFERGTVSASDADLETARAAATEVPLFSSGPFDAYGKCFADSDDDKVYSTAYVRTSKSRSILDNINSTGGLGGGAAAEFFNTGTLEPARQIGIDVGADAGKGLYLGEIVVWFTDFHAISPDGESLFAWVNTAGKNGALAGGNGPYLSGDSCIWQGYYIETS